MSFSNCFMLFIIYSFLGWIMEVLWTFLHTGKFVNRGFLIGPYCPIYGLGCLLLIVFLDRFKENIFVLFLMSIIICSALEYFASFIMEKLFNARWWDYTHYKFNLNGRICVETMVPFGFLGVLVVRVINPVLFSFSSVNNIVFYIVFALFVIDILVSLCIIDNIKSTVWRINCDNTEEISKKVKDVLLSKSFLHKRLIKAFPTFRESLVKLKEFVTK